MFLGSYKPSFNQKARRVALPKKIRDYLATSEIIVSYGFESCLFGFDTTTWEKEAAKQLALPLTERHPRNIRRFFFATAKLIGLDDQGRFVIPEHLVQYAKIARPIVIGAGDHFEIWDEAIWQKQLSKLEKESQ